MPAHRGHFLLESGLHSDLWLDLDALFIRPGRLRPFVAGLAGRLAEHRVEVVCGPLVGGAFVAQLVAAELDADFAYSERLVTAAGAEFRLPPWLRMRVRGRRVAVLDDAISAGSAVGATLTELRACGAVPVAIGALLVLAARPKTSAGSLAPMHPISGAGSCGARSRMSHALAALLVAATGSGAPGHQISRPGFRPNRLGPGAERLAAGAGLPLERLADRSIGLWEPAACPLCRSGAPLGRSGDHGDG